MYNHKSDTHKEYLALVLKPKSLSILKVKEFSAVFLRYSIALILFFFNKSSPYLYCAITYYFNSHYSTWIYSNMSQVEYILVRKYAVFLLVCIRSLWSTPPCSKWTGIRQFMWRKIHIYELVSNHSICPYWQNFGQFTGKLIHPSVP